MVFPSQTHPILWVRKQSTETNVLRLQTTFSTQETERQTLPFAKWLLNKETKTKMMKKGKKHFTLHTGHRTPNLSLSRQAFTTQCYIRIRYWKIYLATELHTAGSSAPKHPFFQVQWLTATLIYLQGSLFVCSISVICSIHLLFATLAFICSVLFFFAAYFFSLQRTFFLCSELFFYLQRFFFVCGVSFLFAACPFYEALSG